MIEDTLRIAQSRHIHGDAKIIHPQREIPCVLVDPFDPEVGKLMPNHLLHFHVTAAVLAELPPLIREILGIVERPVLLRDTEAPNQRLALRILALLQVQHLGALLQTLGYTSDTGHGRGAFPLVQRNKRLPVGAAQHRQFKWRVVGNQFCRGLQQLQRFRIGANPAHPVEAGVHPEVDRVADRLGCDSHHQDDGGFVTAIAIRANRWKVGA